MSDLVETPNCWFSNAVVQIGTIYLCNHLQMRMKITEP